MKSNSILIWFGLLLLIGILAACQTDQNVLLSPSNTPVDSPMPKVELTAPTETAENVVEATETADSPVLTPTDTQPAVEMPSTGAVDSSNVQWKLILQGLRQPVFITSAEDGSGRLFIVLQTGQILVLQDGVLQEEPFLDISDRTTRPNLTGSLGERGLLGLAFHPRYAETGEFFVNYTDRSGNTHIAKFIVSKEQPNRVDPSTEQQVLYVEQPYGNHNGGALAFGSDGMLYIGLGDGGSAGDPLANGQSLQTLLGKVLRVDVDGDQPYVIPEDNPYTSGGGLGEIWAYGLRNPWRIAFDRLSGDLYIADVGQNTYEEINFQPVNSQGGENYGWNYREGLHAFAGTPDQSVFFVDPIAEYTHSEGCSVTGGVVYRGVNLPEWQGVYLYGDYCTGKIWGLWQDAEKNWQNKLFFETSFNITSFGIDEIGEVYVIDYQQGAVYRLETK